MAERLCLRCPCGGLDFKSRERGKTDRRGRVNIAGTCKACGRRIETTVQDDPYDPIRIRN